MAINAIQHNNSIEVHVILCFSRKYLKSLVAPVNDCNPIKNLNALMRIL